MTFRPLAFALAIMSVTMAVPGCATAPAGAPVTPANTLKSCSDAAVDAGAKSILGEVTSALSTGNYVAALADLALRFGEPEVVCAVTYVVQELQTKLAASAPGSVSPVIAGQVSRGQAYLNAHPASAATTSLLQHGEAESRVAHNHEIVGSNPTAATSLDACDAACGAPGSSLAPPSGCQCWRASVTDWRKSRWVALAR